MIWSAAAGSFGGLLLARLFLGVATAAAGPLIASLTGVLAAGEEGARPGAAGQMGEAGPGAAERTAPGPTRSGSPASAAWAPTWRALPADPSRMGLLAVARYVLRIRTNVILIIACACAYYFLAGVEIFGTEFTRDQYHINKAVGSLVLLVLGAGAGAVPGVLVGGALLRRRHLTGRVLVPGR